MEKEVLDRKIRMRAYAILTRAKDAGIPEKHMRIAQDEFASMRSPKFHKDPSEFANKLYKMPTSFSSSHSFALMVEM